MKKTFFESRFWKILVFVLPIILKKMPFTKTQTDEKRIDDVADILK